MTTTPIGWRGTGRFPFVRRGVSWVPAVQAGPVLAADVVLGPGAVSGDEVSGEDVGLGGGVLGLLAQELDGLFGGSEPATRSLHLLHNGNLIANQMYKPGSSLDAVPASDMTDSACVRGSLLPATCRSGIRRERVRTWRVSPP